MSYSKTLYKLPIILGLLFSLFTIFLYEFGPIDYPDVNKSSLYLFLFISNLAMYLGFTNGAYSPIRRYQGVRWFPINKVINVLFVIALITAIPKFLIFTGMRSLSFSEIASRVTTFLESASEVYELKQGIRNVSGIWKYINYFVVLCGPLHWCYIPLSIYYWPKLSAFKRIGSIFIWALYLLQFVCTGTNVGFFNFLIAMATVILARYLKRTIDSGKRISFKKGIRVIIVLLLSVFVALWVFNFIMGSRIGDTYDRVRSTAGFVYSLDKTSFLYIVTPPGLRPLLVNLTSYIAHPYMALALSFDLPFQGTFGVGYSWFLLDNFPVPFDAWSRTYQMSMEIAYGYDHWACWHTSYMWFANDVSFFGVPLILFLLFRLFGRAWRSFLDSGNAVSLLLFMLFIIMIEFISANNQVFQSSDTLFAFWLLLIIHRYSQRFNWK